ncbi:MAG: hypothetical protein V1492_03645 [Candidatus Micrarchaeota archaeon]
MRAFVFSLDSFVAFILALVAVYSLIFFSSVPSAYYFLLTQAHYLSKDALLTASTASCDTDYGQCVGSQMDQILLETSSVLQREEIDKSFGKMIPNQFGYALETKAEGDWQVLYDTRNASTKMPENKDKHATVSKKLEVATEMVNFVFEDDKQKEKRTTNPYLYNTCDGGAGQDGRLITCGGLDLDATQLVQPPETESKLVRLRIFI